jgi:hypothetical protein
MTPDASTKTKKRSMHDLGLGISRLGMFMGGGMGMYGGGGGARKAEEMDNNYHNFPVVVLKTLTESAAVPPPSVVSLSSHTGSRSCSG